MSICTSLVKDTLYLAEFQTMGKRGKEVQQGIGGTTNLIRVLILLSLLFQCILVCCASEKKRARKTWLKKLIFFAYFYADWVAPTTIGVISVKLGSSGSHNSTAVVENAVLLAFWAPFLLLHLGGPDNVTSLYLLENEKWLQKLIRLISNVAAITVIYIRSFPNNPLYLATLMVFAAGILKYGERVLSLYLASWESWKDSAAVPVTPHAGSDYEKLSVATLAVKEANLPTLVKSKQLPPKKFKPYSPMPRNVELDFNSVDKQLDGKSLLQFALSFYINFRGFFIGSGLTYGHKQRQFTREFFLRRSSHDAFKLAEIELSFVHEDLHTKATVTRIPALRIITLTLIALRIITLALIAAATFSFCLYDKRGLSKIDISISYALLFGALVLEIVSLLMLLLSGRNVIVLNYYNLVKPVVDAIVNRPKWSESYSRCNLICLYLFDRTPDIKRFTAQNIRTGVVQQANILPQKKWSMRLGRAFTRDTVPDPMKDKIFTKLCERSKLAENVETATKICSQRGDWVLMQRSCYSQLKWSLGEVEYGHSLLLWHIATDLLCCCPNDSDQFGERQFCKEISEYLLYLLLVKPKMVAPVAGKWLNPFWDTFLEAKRLFNNKSIKDHDQACQAILLVDTDIKPVFLKGDLSASVLFDSTRLAKQLLKVKEDDRWSLMSGVWMELMTYAAFHCEGTVHARQPSKGGELLTFVWLLMNHLGLGKQFREH